VPRDQEGVGWSDRNHSVPRAFPCCGRVCVCRVFVEETLLFRAWVRPDTLCGNLRRLENRPPQVQPLQEQRTQKIPSGVVPWAWGQPLQFRSRACDLPGEISSAGGIRRLGGRAPRAGEQLATETIQHLPFPHMVFRRLCQKGYPRIRGLCAGLDRISQGALGGAQHGRVRPLRLPSGRVSSGRSAGSASCRG